VFTLRKPDAEHLSHFLARQRTAPLTYTEVGATFADTLPAGYHHTRAATDLGTGAPVWDRARGISIAPPAAPITEGTTVAVITSVGPLQLLAACRIVRVVDEPDRFGFAYGTLPAHPEEGEERFLVATDGQGAVRFEVVAFSRAHDLLTRLGGPIPRRMQARATEHYLQGMRAFVTAP
jgi:uncharacterized protein (UPF0548 family)